MFGDAQQNSLADFGEVFAPSEAIEPILAQPVRSALTEWLTEIWAKDELAGVGLKPRSKTLFQGAPGTGKTTLAHHLAARLGMRMLAIRPDRIVNSYLGSTGKALGKLFDLAKAAAASKAGPVVMFFDEFDAIAAKRQADARDAQREMNSVVDVLLQRFDAFDGFIIAATNHGAELDPAIYRRFDIQITLESPGQRERERILERYLGPYGLPAPELTSLAQACDQATPALLRNLCEGLKRNIILGPKIGWPMGREVVFSRVLSAIQPHADNPTPKLWKESGDCRAIAGLSWPLPLAIDIPALVAAPKAEPGETVVHFKRPQNAPSA